jgi:dihydrofolate reductase
MTISLIVAAAANNAIGKDNQLLWHLPNDMKFFKATTWGLPLIMGRKTFESVGGKPLPGRTNIVISRDANFNAKGIVTAASVAAALQKAEACHCREVMVAGGGLIYEAFLPLAKRIYLTRVDTAPEADTFFPPMNEKEWELFFRQPFEKDEKHAFAYRFETWQRIAGGVMALPG